LDFRLTKNAIEDLDFVDAPGEGIINSVTEDSYLGGKRVIGGSAAVVTTKDKGRLTRSVKVKLEPFGAAGGPVIGDGDMLPTARGDDRSIGSILSEVAVRVSDRRSQCAAAIDVDEIASLAPAVVFRDDHWEL
jgi:hypothetical protein